MAETRRWVRGRKGPRGWNLFMIQPKPGEVYWVELGMAAKQRPLMVVSREDASAPRALAVCVPLTTQARGSRYEVRCLACGGCRAAIRAWRMCRGSLESSTTDLQKGRVVSMARWWRRFVRRCRGCL